jgi:hypothetical protein
MSLWYKTIISITYRDVEAFCQLALPEGLRLDYKADVPSDLAKTIAAFANTRGGLIILGVAADKVTNKPVWDATGPHGFSIAPGIEERITAIARDGVYPPIRPQISPALPVPEKPDRVLMVVRVDESPDAPHGVDQGRKVYERTGNQSKPFEYAHVERIAQLLERRRSAQDIRERVVQRAVDRLERLVPTDWPVRWISIIPLFPTGPLCNPEWCWRYASRARLPSIPQWIHGGALVTHHQQTGQNFSRSGFSSLESNGHAFSCAIALEQTREKTDDIYNSQKEVKYISFSKTIEFYRATASETADFYSRAEVEKPGLVQIRIGVRNAFNLHMFRETYPMRRSFPDHEFTAETVLHSQQLIDDGEKAIQAMLQELAFAFDVVHQDWFGR